MLTSAESRIKMRQCALECCIHLKNGAGRKLQTSIDPPQISHSRGINAVRGKCYRNGKWKQTNIYNISDTYFHI